MNETISQIQTVVTLAIASTLINVSTVAQSHDPASSTDSLNATLISRNYNNLAATTRSSATVNGNSYSFTMTLPQRSGNRFAKLSFSLTNLDRRNAIVPLPLNLRNTVAQVGTGNTNQVKDTFIDETGTVWVEFNSPVPAKTMLTVTFKARKPLLAGRYSYSIAAYPEARRSGATFVSDGTFVAR
ncbi:MAG: hypothetical protein C4288_02980 [Leptolyngbya sp. ERB_1_1]